MYALQKLSVPPTIQSRDCTALIMKTFPETAAHLSKNRPYPKYKRVNYPHDGEIFKSFHDACGKAAKKDCYEWYSVCNHTASRFRVCRSLAGLAGATFDELVSYDAANAAIGGPSTPGSKGFLVRIDRQQYKDAFDALTNTERWRIERAMSSLCDMFHGAADPDTFLPIDVIEEVVNRFFAMKDAFIADMKKYLPIEDVCTMIYQCPCRENFSRKTIEIDEIMIKATEMLSGCYRKSAVW